MTPVAAIAGVLVAGYVPTSRDPRAPRTDRAGFALSTATIGLLVYTIIEAPDHGWASARTLAGFALTAVLAGRVRGLGAAHRASDARPEPVPQPAVHRRQRSVTISFFALFGFIFLVTQYFQFVKGYGPLSTGVRLLPVALTRRGLLDPRRPGSRSGSAPSWSSQPGCPRWRPSTSGSPPRPPPPATGRSPPRWSCSGPAWASPPRPPPRRSWASSRRQGRRRVGGQRRHPAARRHPRRRRDRQRLRLAVRQPAHQRPPPRLPATVPPTAHGSVGAALTVAGELGHSGHPALAAAVHERRQLCLLPRLPHRQLRLRRRRRRGRPNGARTTPRPPHRQHRRHARYTSTVPPATVTAPNGF